MNEIPLVDLKLQYDLIKTEILQDVDQVCSSSAFIQGKYARKFEEDFSALQKIPYTVGCSNGTSAISILLEALGIGKGAEVIVPTLTFIATAEPVCHVGAVPIFVDVEPSTLNIDTAKLEAAITANTKAILPVHLYGNPANMKQILNIANKHNLTVIEDAAQAHLAKLDGATVGNFGAAATFSFYPGKNLGAYGDAGCICSSNKELIDQCRVLLDHGRSEKYLHHKIGYNQRMDGIQAAILSTKMRYLEGWTARRKAIAAQYREALSHLNQLRIVEATPGAEPVYHLFVVEVDDREGLANFLKKRNIASGVHYPIPLHLQPAFSKLNYRAGDFPVAERACQRILSLPIYPEMTEQQIAHVTESVQSFFR